MIRSFRLTIGLAVGALAVLALAGGPARAGDGRVPLPHLAKARGEHCVEPTEVMRKNHFDFLLHQRDETMHEGIRDSKFSITGCVACHAAPDPKTPDSKVESIEPFCDQCHAYAAVKPDCWSCHTRVLTDAVKQAALHLNLAPDNLRALRQAFNADKHAAHNPPLQTNQTAAADQKALIAQLKAHLAQGGASR